MLKIPNPHFSFIILTFNEEQHIGRLLESIKNLNARTYILDSGSTDNTLSICHAYRAKTAIHPFENHPTQWHHALHSFLIETPWVIALDADQLVSPQLYQLLENFKDGNYKTIDGIYFNRKNYFKGKWIRHGGYFPKYLLKMFRFNCGYSDLNENMDHRFITTGKTAVWKNGFLIEENLKENLISFWVEKHNRYSDLLAEEAINRLHNPRKTVLQPNLWGSPNEHNAWQKKYWHKMPLYIRPFLYFGYRMIFQLGILDGKTGITFHFMQGFWFRLLVDIKIEERIKKEQPAQNSTFHFPLSFIGWFIFLYFFHIAFIGLSTPGNLYISFLDKHLNYIATWRTLYISSAANILQSLGYPVHTTTFSLNVPKHSGFRMAYSCLGYGIASVFTAFIIAFPKPLRSKLLFLPVGLFIIQVLNTWRLILITLYWDILPAFIKTAQHEIFNCGIYLLICLMIYAWTASPLKKHATHTT